MKFIVLEGLDGAGKSTQIKALGNYLDNKNISQYYIHFPRTDSRIFGNLIARYLRGEFGDLNQLDPHLVALIYAGDRKDAAPDILQHLNNNDYVIVDRYVYSNIAYQCAKYKNKQDQDSLKKWILDLEYNYYQIPRPDLSIFLDVPFKFTEAKLSGQREGDDRDYLNGNTDIHEDDLHFQQFVRTLYLDLAGEDDHLKIIDCGDPSGGILPPEKIFEKILTVLKNKNLIS
jgi:dTMP kinase